MVERKVTVNPRASAVVITNSPNHVQVDQNGIKKLKNEVRMSAAFYLQYYIFVVYLFRW